MLGISDLLENSSGAATAGNHEGEVGVDGSITGGFEEEERGRGEDGERNLAGNRWPRQETLALLKIRSDMDGAFRDSAPKAPLWEEVSRKLAELGYHRSAKKCKEKFENVYKYHKRTKEGRTSRHDGKTYRFFDQLQALDNHPISLPPLSSPKPLQTPTPAMPIPYPPPTSQQTLPSSVHNPITTNTTNPDQILTSPTSCSSSSSEEAEGSRRKKKKLSAFFDKLMKEVVERQEILQKRFLEAIEKRERERMAREEAWKMQEVARLNREHEMLVQERSIAAAKDAAVIAFLQKISDQSNPLQIMEVQSQENPSPSKKIVENPRTGNADNFPPASSSRWPKAEVEALIRLRTSLDVKYQDNGSKGPLWEEISTAMRKVGYNRSAKRCKEKWENINKYYKKVKESNKKRPEDSKTCPYFHQLDALYKEKTKKIDNSFASGFGLNSENQPQPLRQEPQRPQSVMEDLEPESTDPNQEEDGDDEEEDEDEGGDYEIVSNNPSSVAIVG